MHFKKSRFLLIPLLLISFLSCDDSITVTSDDYTPSTGSPDEDNYLPTAKENVWIYGFGQEDSLNNVNGRDTTIMTNPVETEGKIWTPWTNLSHVSGIFSTLGIRKEDSTTYAFPLNINDFPYVSDVEFTEPIVLIKDDSSVGDVLSSIEITQNLTSIPIPDSLDYDITGSITPIVTLAFETVHANHFDVIDLNGSTTYQNVYKTEIGLRIKLELKVEATYQGVPITLNHTLLPDQNFGDWSLWFANDIGLVRSTYEFSISDVNTTVSIPGLGNVDLEDLDFDVSDYLDNTYLKGVAELIEYQLVD